MAAAIGGWDRGRLPLYLWGLAAVLILATAWEGLFSPRPLWIPFPLGFYGNHLLVDPLSAWFLLLLALVFGLIAASSGPYLQHLPDRSRRLVRMVLPLFLLSMVLVLTAHQVLLFLLAWEVMTVTSYLLVVAGTDPRAETNGFVYLVMTHIGTGFLLLFFLLLGGLDGGNLSFSALAQVAGHLSPGLKGVLGLLALAGLGMKLGLLPVHIWLPRAHPVAPAPVSALMSGVMLKMALYLMIRVFLFWLAPLPLPLDLALVVLGLLTGLFGVLYAVVESDLKTFLAYSSIEQMGIATAILGLAALAQTLHHPALTALLLFALLLHALVHGLAKGGLFLAAGYLEALTGTRDLNRLGGLWSRLPSLATAFLAGALTLSALPPFPGFWVEWLLLQGGLHLGLVHSPLAVLLLLVVAAIGMIGALAASAFLKAFGLVFLGRARSERPPLHVPSAQRILLFPAAVLGGMVLLPGSVGWLLLRVVPSAARVLAITPLGWFLGSAAISPGITAVLLLLLTLLLGRGVRPRTDTSPLWACGGTATPAVQCSDPAYGKGLRLMLPGLFRAERSLVVEGSNYFPMRMRYEGRIPRLFERYLYLPSVRRLLSAARVLRVLQSGGVRLYLTYLVGTLLLLLAFAW